MQPVGGGEVACPPIAGANRRRVLAYLTHFVMADPHARTGGSVEKCAAEPGSAYAARGAMAEWRGDRPVALQVADPPERLAVRVHAKPFQVPQRKRHQPFTARLVDRSAPSFDDDHVQSGFRAVD